MINNISELIAKKWVLKNMISENEYELYHYGLFVVLSDLWLFIFTLMMGVIFKIALSSVVFFVIFFVIRRFAGGFHAKTELHCQMISLSFLFLSVLTIKYLFFCISGKYLLVINLVCVIVLNLVSPADTPQKPLTISERKMFKRITGFIGMVFLVINGILSYFKVQFIGAPIVCAFVLETILVIFGRLFNKRLADS